MDHYSLTPFDEKYLKVPYEWMEFCYIRYITEIPLEYRRQHYLQKQAKEESQEKYDEDLEKHLPPELVGDEERREEILEAFRGNR